MGPYFPWRFSKILLPSPLPGCKYTCSSAAWASVYFLPQMVVLKRFVQRAENLAQIAIPNRQKVQSKGVSILAGCQYTLSLEVGRFEAFCSESRKPSANRDTKSPKSPKQAKTAEMKVFDKKTPPSNKALARELCRRGAVSLGLLVLLSKGGARNENF